MAQCRFMKNAYEYLYIFIEYSINASSSDLATEWTVTINTIIILKTDCNRCINV